MDPLGLRAALDALPAPDPAELSRPVPAKGSTVRFNDREWRVGPSEVTRQGWTALDLVAADDGRTEANGVPHFKVEIVRPTLAARNEGMTTFATDLIAAFRSGGAAAFNSPETTVRAVARRRGVQLDDSGPDRRCASCGLTRVPADHLCTLI
jgi:hypothetical protein